MKDNFGNILTKEQEQYFKNSKILNNQNELVVCFHSTNADFDVFDLEKSGVNGTLYGAGFYFSTNDENIYSYGDKYKKCYLNIESPFIFNENTHTDKKLAKEIILKFTGSVDENVLDNIFDSQDTKWLELDTKLIRYLKDTNNKVESFNDILKACGYDGVIVLEDNDIENKYTEIIAFYPNQIKSLDNLTPTSSNNINESLLLEKKRQELITQGRKGANYAPNNQFRGKNRFERKKYSKVARNVSQFNDIDMNAFFKKDILTVGIRVQGETDYYIVKIKFEGVLKELQRYIKQNNNKFEYKVVLQALTRVFNTGDIYVNCTCPDFKFRFDFWSTVNNYNSGNPQNIPAKITNPNNTKGSGCKHVLLVLANVEWLLRVASVINNYVNYAETHLQKLYADYIFPQIYGVKYSKEVQLQLTDTDEVTSDKELIDIANRLGRNRGRFSSTYQPDRAKGRNAFKKQIGATVEPKGNIKGNSSQKEESGSKDLKSGKNNNITFTKRNNKKDDLIEPIDEK